MQNQQQNFQEQKSQGANKQQQVLPSYTEENIRTLKFLFAGGMGGAVSRTATAPIDRCKMIMQVYDQQTMTMSKAFVAMYKDGGFFQMFKGNGANVLKIAPEMAIRLTVSDRLKRNLNINSSDITIFQRFYCGALAGVIAQTTIYPLETVKTRLALSTSANTSYNRVFQTMFKIIEEEKIKGLFRGLVPSLIGIIPYAGLEIMFFELFKKELLERYDDKVPALAILGAGTISACIAQTVSYPLALTRTRLQAQGGSARKVRYNGMTDVFIKTLQYEGFRGLYKGLLPNMIKLAPAAGINWLTFEYTKKLLGVDVHT